MPASAIRVQDYRELQRAFAKADKQMQRDFNAALKDAAEPVRAEAQSLAGTRIRNLAPGDPWSQMRVGVTRKSVYVAPKKRGTRTPTRRRRNLAGLLLDRAMEPALDNNIGKVEERVDDLLAEMGRTWERG